MADILTAPLRDGPKPFDPVGRVIYRAIDAEHMLFVRT